MLRSTPLSMETMAISRSPLQYHYITLSEDTDHLTITFSISLLHSQWRQRPSHDHLFNIITSLSMKTKAISRLPLQYHYFTLSEHKGHLTITSSISLLHSQWRQRPSHDHLFNIIISLSVNTKAISRSPLQYYCFTQWRQRPSHDHLFNIIASFSVNTKAISRSPLQYHCFTLSEDKGHLTITSSTSLLHSQCIQRPSHDHLFNIIASLLVKT